MDHISKAATVLPSTAGQLPERQYGLPEKVKFCKKCVMPNTRPTSCNEYQHHIRLKHQFIDFDEEGVCSACRFCEAKYDGSIDWLEREKELLDLLAKYRRTDGSYDVLVPGSGGKDSCYAAHILKYKYNMHPLTVTWAPHLYTDIGFHNFQNWIHVGGFDNYLFTPNGKIHRMLTRNAFLRLLHPFQPFILGQKTFAVKMALRFNIPLIFYGESPGEYGANVSIHQNKFSAEDKNSEGFRLDFLQGKNLDEIYLGGASVAEYLQNGISKGDLEPYFPADPEDVAKQKTEFHYLGYYLNWHPQGTYYYAVKHCGFEAAPDRTPGTYSKYNSLDDRTDDFFYYTTLVKFGYGRATQDASQEIRNKEITREEGVALVNRFRGEFPTRYFKDFLEYINIDEQKFHETVDSFRDASLWGKTDEGWKLRYTVQ
ncbi:MAG: N-acetyl sugar amidotransferase [Candidatus Peribacteraceae bacterium]|nr:N-acetyl sugar amidotransferase [Candidatus Peribacteraceae bacterium]MDD5741909.1 N-acetyl sugar amidotransferase [Candidatus Peribacteraceae bacterium]